MISKFTNQITSFCSLTSFTATFWLQWERSAPWYKIFPGWQAHSLCRWVSTRASGHSGEESARQCRRHGTCGFHPRVRTIPWSRKWQPTQYPCLENSMDKGDCCTTVHRVGKSQIWLSIHTHTYITLYTFHTTIHFMWTSFSVVFWVLMLNQIHV